MTIGEEVLEGFPDDVTSESATRGNMTDTTDDSRHQASTPRPGRPTIYSADLAATICALIAARIPVVEICDRVDMPSKDTLYRWKRENKEFSDQYARAREDRADARQDRIDEIVKKMLGGEIEPQAARVAIDAEKWQMSKEQPKRYGERLAVGGDEDAPPIQVTRIERVIVRPSNTETSGTGRE